ncbi:MAG: hypothetical protein LKE39_05290 [Sphaerochaeta sp.]|jgi:hypothetical protein|nr:hypothetical protein [Sphaerochaeta sp.]
MLTSSHRLFQTEPRNEETKITTRKVKESDRFPAVSVNDSNIRKKEGRA